ncbi:hypothetical protein [Prochlorothrix hollandica]|uniref:Uncharacterized protein n=1 Tax=Prochlorothrix hollandica PCC 9006 = CALU 1027 TaxID=317619 RepID=A0A0M2PNB3_PROHO|nr:hypothetical protein [Prochlorothrix hollandica]KKI98105.1 hypothetical protein PROH_20550 [Prochlorothrix hollandica PCC 9006 = CALU 1027]
MLQSSTPRLPDRDRIDQADRLSRPNATATMKKRQISDLVSNPTTFFFGSVVILLVISVSGVILFHWSEVVKKATLGFWVIVPPCWFWYEFCFLYERKNTPFPEDFEKFKYGQELSRNLWLAISAALLLLYFGKLPGF